MEMQEFFPYRALIVDYSRFYRTKLASELDPLGVKVVGSTTTLHKAISAISQVDPNIIILDIIMPDDNGLRLIKKYQDYLDQKFFIIISGLNQKNIIMDTIKSGATDFLPKPFNRKIFVQAILAVKQKIDKQDRPS